MTQLAILELHCERAGCKFSAPRTDLFRSAEPDRAGRLCAFEYASHLGSPLESLSGTRIEQDRATEIDVDHAIGERRCLDPINGNIDHGRRDLLVERRALA
jgi:hypothetical protein